MLRILVAVAAFGAVSVAQQNPAFRSSVQTVALYATVVDDKGRLVPDLAREHFEIYDNGKLQELTVFENAVQPIRVVVMLDTSGSMTLYLELLKQAAEQFVIRLLPEDRARVGSFSDKIWISPEFTHNRDDLIRVLHNDIQFGNPTRLWDAIDESMTALSREQGRRVVLVFTDGEDSASRKADDDGVLARAIQDEYMVYAIGLRTLMPGVNGPRESRPDRDLKKLAEQTGGGFIELTRATDLGAAFTRVADELHRQYVLGFTPSVLDNRSHVLEVKVKVAGMTARARRSYVARPPGEPAESRRAP
jgi:Ca-activated chloride channel family protein